MDRREFLGTTVGAMATASGLKLASTYAAGYSRRVLDYSGELDSNFPHIARKNTKFLVLHCTTGGEGDFEKSLKGLLSPGVNAHFLINRNGDIYKLVPDDLVAFHAGVSRWDGYENLNYLSLGVEFAATGYEPLTKDQYDSFRFLYRDNGGLKQKYDLDDIDVLPHSWVAYCKSPQMHKRKGFGGTHEGPHRGAKSDPGVLFIREDAGIFKTPDFDPDVASGHMIPAKDSPKLVLDANRREMIVVQDGRKVRRYVVAIDKSGPDAMHKGKFQVSIKDRNPPINEYGNFYLALKNGKNRRAFAIHGTPPTTVNAINLWGRSYLHDFYPGFNDWTHDGNVGMDDKELREIFDNLLIGTSVEVK